MCDNKNTQFFVWIYFRKDPKKRHLDIFSLLIIYCKNWVCKFLLLILHQSSPSRTSLSPWHGNLTIDQSHVWSVDPRTAAISNTFMQHNRSEEAECCPVRGNLNRTPGTLSKSWRWTNRPQGPWQERAHRFYFFHLLWIPDHVRNDAYTWCAYTTHYYFFLF